MKKTYISPSMVVVRLAMTQPLATSDPTATFNPNETPIDGATIDVKAFNNIIFFDDEW